MDDFAPRAFGEQEAFDILLILSKISQGLKVIHCKKWEHNMLTSKWARFTHFGQRSSIRYAHFPPPYTYNTRR
jgi:hypothetical protein